MLLCKTHGKRGGESDTTSKKAVKAQYTELAKIF